MDEPLLSLVYHIFLPEELFSLYPLHPPRLSHPHRYTVIRKQRYLEKQSVKLFPVIVQLPAPFPGEK